MCGCLQANTSECHLFSTVICYLQLLSPRFLFAFVSSAGPRNSCYYRHFVQTIHCLITTFRWTPERPLSVAAFPLCTDIHTLLWINSFTHSWKFSFKHCYRVHSTDKETKAIFHWKCFFFKSPALSLWLQPLQKEHTWTPLDFCQTFYFFTLRLWLFDIFACNSEKPLWGKTKWYVFEILLAILP